MAKESEKENGMKSQNFNFKTNRFNGLRACLRSLCALSTWITGIQKRKESFSELIWTLSPRTTTVAKSGRVKVCRTIIGLPQGIHQIPTTLWASISTMAT